MRNKERTLVPTDVVRGLTGVKLETQGVSASQAWNNKASVAQLREVVCANLGGQFVASADATQGTCATPTATIVCKDTLRGQNCVGIADTKKRAASLSKRVTAVLRDNAAGTSSPSTTATPGGTTTTGATTTTSATTTTTTSPGPTTTLSPSRR